MVPRLLILIALPFLILGGLASAQSDPLDAPLGQAFFNRLWVSAPSSTAASDGLGPMFDARACASCHKKAGPGTIGIRADGTLAHPGLILRLSRRHGAPDPVYGAQFNSQAVQGLAAEGVIRILTKEENGLRRFIPRSEALAFGPLAPDTALSLRRAPSLRGIGRLAAVPQSVILTQPGHPADGVKGRPNWITDETGARVLGRFGWKASEPDLAGQIARAFSRDIGLSTQHLPEPWGDCTAHETACRAAPHGGTLEEPEVAPAITSAIERYLLTFPAPSRAGSSAKGAKTFAQIGCAACHTSLEDGDGRPVPAFTDLLLHDMGPGLADGVKEGEARGEDWRTAPLWGLSASLAAGGLLHDGRARSIDEAIRWHGGEAKNAAARYGSLSEAGRTALLDFLSGL